MNKQEKAYDVIAEKNKKNAEEFGLKNCSKIASGEVVKATHKFVILYMMDIIYID